MDDIQGLVVQVQQQVTWTWGGDSSGKYSVGNAYILLNRVVEINDASCSFCRSHEEDASHLFSSCDKVLLLWWESMSWINTVGAFSETPKNHFLQFSNCNSDGFRGQRWQSWWIALTWCTWHHRNRIVFLNESLNGHKLMEDALFFCWTWFKNLERGFDIPFHSWSSNIRDFFVLGE